MIPWTPEQLDGIAAADEISIQTLGRDGTLRPAVRVWVVRVGDEVYVRSWKGQDGAWFRSATRAPEGAIRVAGTATNVTFDVAAPTELRTDIDAAYRAKYGRYGDAYLLPRVSDSAAAATVRLRLR